MKKFFIIFSISFLLVTLPSCYLNKTLTSQQEFMKYLKKENGTLKMDERNSVYQVITYQGDTINFNKKFAGKIAGNGVIGFPEVRILYESADSVLFSEKSLKSIWVNGTGYRFIEQDIISFVTHVSDTVFIPFSNIEKMKVRAFNIHLTTASYTIPISILLTLTLLAFNAMRTCC